MLYFSLLALRRNPSPLPLGNMQSNVWFIVINESLVNCFVLAISLGAVSSTPVGSVFGQMVTKSGKKRKNLPCQFFCNSRVWERLLSTPTFYSSRFWLISLVVFNWAVFGCILAPGVHILVRLFRACFPSYSHMNFY